MADRLEKQHNNVSKLWAKEKKGQRHGERVKAASCCSTH
jgi:hypothetical protein